MSELDRLAALVGIEPYFHDIFGARRDTGDATKRALLAAMGLPASTDNDVAQSLRSLEARAWSRPLPPVAVVTEGAAIAVPVAARIGFDGAMLAWTLTEEGGAVHRGGIPFAALADIDRRDVNGVPHRRRSLTVPVRPGLGYHTLTVSLGGGEPTSMRVIVAPERCLLPEEVAPQGGRCWGIGLQLYGLRSATDWGIGDFDDLGRFARIAGDLGASLVGLNPLHALFPSDPGHFGPYSPSSRSFLNILYIDVEAVPDLAECEEARAMLSGDAFRHAVVAARGAELVDYPAVARLKMPVLETLFRSFQARDLDRATERAMAFDRFRAEIGPALRRHAVFEALHEHFFLGESQLWSWQNWPAEFQNPDSPAVAAFAEQHADRVAFYEWLQWEADRQLGAAAAAGRSGGLGIGFYRDLAVAVNPGGAAAWSDRTGLVQGASVGAPPDAFNLKGQNWGLSPLSPVGLVETAYEPFIGALRANMRHAGALRIDHVMALKHLFWIPADGSDGAYVEYPFEDLLRIVALESVRNRCVVIGEDLGTVPEGFRPALHDAGILSYRVLYFERDAAGDFLPPADYPQRSMVTVSTHDLATFKGFWEGRDLDWRVRLDLYPDAAARDKDAWDRGADRWRLLRALNREGLRPPAYPNDEGDQPWSRPLSEAVHRFLAGSPGAIAMVQIEDALCEDEQPNLPGTTDQHPNWRRRLRLAVEDLTGDAGVTALAAALHDGRGIAE